MTKVKICGITRAQDAALAVELGADFRGFIFVPESPRYVNPLECGSIAVALKAAALPPHSKIGVFRGATVDEIRRAIDIAQLDMVQLHGDYHALDLPTIHAFHVKETLPDTSTEADYVLFDTGGGTGRTFDWSLLATYPRTKPFFLAGGITPDNVAEAIETTKPFAIDVASGVEKAPGIKDHDKLKRLFENIRR
jgi:phosphoribosylanthranilate isomerase